MKYTDKEIKFALDLLKESKERREEFNRIGFNAGIGCRYDETTMNLQFGIAVGVPDYITLVNPTHFWNLYPVEDRKTIAILLAMGLLKINYTRGILKINY